MEPITLLGMIAAVLTTVSFFPQVYKVYRTKHTRDLSLPMYAIFSAGVVLWLIYGVAIINPPIILANSVILLCCAYILSIMIKNRRVK